MKELVRAVISQYRLSLQFCGAEKSTTFIGKEGRCAGRHSIWADPEYVLCWTERLADNISTLYMVGISQKVITVIIAAGEGIFLFLQNGHTSYGASLPPIEWEAGFCVEAERPVCEATHFIWCQEKNEQSFIHPSSPPVWLQNFLRDQFTLFVPNFNISSAINFIWAYEKKSNMED